MAGIVAAYEEPDNLSVYLLIFEIEYFEHILPNCQDVYKRQEFPPFWPSNLICGGIPKDTKKPANSQYFVYELVG